MRSGVMLIVALVLLAGCAPAKYPQGTRMEAHCRTHARTATFSGSADEGGPYLECLHTEGVHEVEVREVK